MVLYHMRALWVCGWNGPLIVHLNLPCTVEIGRKSESKFLGFKEVGGVLWESCAISLKWRKGRAVA
jgi:hypothetical protein